MRKDTKAPSSLPSDYRRGLHESHYAKLHCDERLSNPQPQKLLLILLAGGDIRQKLEFHHVHLELGALVYIESFLFYWS